MLTKETILHNIEMAQNIKRITMDGESFIELSSLALKSLDQPDPRAEGVKYCLEKINEEMKEYPATDYKFHLKVGLDLIEKIAKDEKIL